MSVKLEVFYYCLGIDVWDMLPPYEKTKAKKKKIFSCDLEKKNADILTVIAMSGYLLKHKCIKPQRSLEELNILQTYLATEASKELCDLGLKALYTMNSVRTCHVYNCFVCVHYAFTFSHKVLYYYCS